MDNVTLARRAYSGFEAAIGRRRTVADYLAFFNRLAIDVVARYTVPEDTPMGGEFLGKSAVVELTVVTAPRLVENVRLTESLTYIPDGNQVCVVGRESYTVRRTGVAVKDRGFGTVLDFAGGSITRIVSYKDMSELVAACQLDRGGD
ncbi:nuclear transport factor 2 family protein [Streptomyces virginiae]|uniref:nuclear transport factor 2 family protein n=1 Tax=Streptomyces virginiae TaxID=1961 RepID=UPI0036ABE1A5